MENSSDFKTVWVHLNRNRRKKIRCYQCIQEHHSGYGIENEMDMLSVDSKLTCCLGRPPRCVCRRHRRRILEGPKGGGGGRGRGRGGSWVR